MNRSFPTVGTVRLFICRGWKRARQLVSQDSRYLGRFLNRRPF